MMENNIWKIFKGGTMTKYIGNYCFSLEVEAENVNEAYEKLEEKLLDLAESNDGAEFLANLEPDIE